MCLHFLISLLLRTLRALEIRFSLNGADFGPAFTDFHASRYHGASTAVNGNQGAGKFWVGVGSRAQAQAQVCACVRVCVGGWVSGCG